MEGVTLRKVGARIRQLAYSALDEIVLYKNFSLITRTIQSDIFGMTIAMPTFIFYDLLFTYVINILIFHRNLTQIVVLRAATKQLRSGRSLATIKETV